MAGLTYLKGGIPRHLNFATAASSTKEKWTWEGGYANYLWLQNTGTGELTVFFTEAAADADTGVTLSAGEKLEIPAEIDSFYTKSSAAESFEAVVFLRRG